MVKRVGADPALWSPNDFEAVTRWTMWSDPPGFELTRRLLKDAVWHAPKWTLGDIRAFFGGMHYSLQQLLPEMVQYDARKEVLYFEIPFFIFQGAADVLTTPGEAEAFFDNAVAQVKRFSLIAGAGHLRLFCSRNSSCTNCSSTFDALSTIHVRL